MTKKINLISCAVLFLAVTLLFSCKKEDNPTLTLQLSQTSIQTQSGIPVKVGLDIVASEGVKDITVEKTVNNVVDQTFQKVTINPATAGATSLKDTFEYVPSVNDINKLVGLKFTVTDKSNGTVSKIVAIEVTLSPKDNLTMKSWKCYSVPIWTAEDPNKQEAGAAVDFDNVITFNADSTFKMNWGTNKGMFDDFTTPVKWWMQGDTVMYRVVNNIFTGLNETQKYYVTELTLEKLTLEQRDIDMSDFGGSKHTNFAYKYNAVIKE